MTPSKRFVILSGPSCVGKGPLQAAVEKFYPGLLKARPILCTSRAPRTGEVHGRTYYFLPPALIKSLQDNPAFVVSQVRSDWQAVDLLQVEELLGSNDLVFAEAYHTFGPALRQKASARQLDLLSVFVLPVPLDTPPNEIVKTMREKLERRGTDSGSKLEERAGLAPDEIAVATDYTHRLLNPVGEDDSGEWGELGTSQGQKGERKIDSLADLGPSARWLIETFVAILRGELPPGDYSRSCT